MSLIIPQKTTWVAAVMGLTLACSLSWAALTPAPTHAATTIPTKINFQGRLTDAAGNIKPNGLYNIKFRLFDALSAGTNKFEEDYTMTGVDNRVQVTNGLFSVQFGTLTSLAAFDFSASPNLWLEVELPTPATATCNTNACAVFTEGAMSPRQPLASAPYAFNADKLDGIDGSQFARNDAGNTFTGASNTFSAAGTALTVTNTASIGTLSVTGSGTLATGLTVTSGGATIGGTIALNGNTTVGSGGLLRVNNATAATQGGIQDATSYALTIAANNDCSADGDIFQNAYVVQGDCGTNTKTYNYVSTHASFGSRGIKFSYGNSNVNGIAFFADAAASTLGAAFTPTQRMIISNTGNVGIGQTSPSYLLDVSGDINSSTALRVGGVSVCTSTGCTASASSGSYIQNTSTQQASSNFNISGNGVAGLSLTTPVLQSAAAAALTITANAASTWSTSAGNLTIQAAGTSTLALDTAGAGTIILGNNATTITLGTGSGAETVNLGNGTGADTVNIGTAGGGDTVNVLTAAGTNTLAIGTSGSTLTTTLASNLTTGSVLTLSDAALSVTNANLANLAFTNANSSVTATTINGLRILPTGSINANANANTLNAINLPGVSPVANNAFYGLNFGTGYNDILRYNNNQLISGTGLIQNAAIDSALTYSNLNKVGALTVGSIASGFGSITTTNAITTTGNISTTGSGTITSSSTITGTTLNATTGINTGAAAGTLRLDSAGALSNITGYSQSSGNFLQSGTGTFGTGTGAVSINGNAKIGVVNQGSDTTERYYPNVISQAFNNTVNGAWIVHTPVPRASQVMSRIHVHGYHYNTSDNIDFYIVVYPYSACNGNVDAVSGCALNYSLEDNGTDSYSKYVGVDASGNIAVAIGDTSSALYFNRISVDAWLTLSTNDYSIGWSIDQNTTAGFGWKDIHGPLKTTKNGVFTVLPNAGNVGIGNIGPSYKLDVSGDINSSTALRVGGVSVCTSSGCTAAASSGSYIQNGTGLQTAANFNIQAANSGVAGTIGGVIRGAAAGQTVDLLQLQSPAGTVLSHFDASGFLAVGTAAALPTGVRLQVTGASRFSNTNNADIIQIENTTNNKGYSIYGSGNDLHVFEYNAGVTGAGSDRLVIQAGGNVSTTGTGSITAAGLLQGNAGLTISGGIANLNVNSNNATNISTGTSTGAITLGGGSETFALQSTGLDVSTAGAITGATTINTSGLITSVGLNAGTGLIQNTGGATLQGVNQLYASSSTSSSTYTGTNWLRAPKNTASAFIGDNDSTAGYVANDVSGNLRFNGSAVAWGDFGYYPNGGGNGNQGNFRLSTGGGVINTTPSGKLGIGDLYVVNNVGIGNLSPSYKLDVSGDINSSTTFRVGGTSGSTTTCSGGQFLQNQVVTGGITTGGTCATASGGGGVTTVGALNGGTANATGATISTSTIFLQSASASFAGLVDTSAQTFAGAKTFSGKLTVGPALGGTALSPTFVTSSGALSSTANSELILGSFGFTGTNTISLGVSAVRTAAGSDWTTTAIGLGLNVDNTLRAGAALWLNANGNVGIGNSIPGNKLTVGTQNGQSNANISARAGNANSFEWGHNNTAGYGNTLGYNASNGLPFLCFSCEAGTSTANSFMTRGNPGTVIQGTINGGLQIGAVTGANADNQALTSRLAIDGSGNINIGGGLSGRRLDVYNSANNGDGLAIGQDADNTQTIQAYIDNQWTNRATYASGCCNVLKLQPDVGSVQIGSAANPTSGLNLYGNLNGNVVVDNQALGTTTTITESTPALAYQLTNTFTGSSGPTITFNITGLPNVDGTLAFIVSSSTKASGPAGSAVTVQINGATISSVNSCICSAAQTISENYTVIRTNGVWRIVGYGNTQGTTNNTTFDTADYAEWIPYSGANKPQSGDLLTVGDTDNSVKRTSTPYDHSMLGVVSTTPYQTASKDDGHSVILALTGRVPVNVSLENGPIKAGDKLTSSSTPGRAMKATGSGEIIGTALSSYDGTQLVAQVMVQLHAGYDSPNGDLQGGPSTPSDIATTGNATVGKDLNVGGTTTTKSLVVSGSANVGGGLTVAGHALVGSLTVSGDIEAKGNLHVDGAITAGSLTIAGPTKLQDLEVGGHFITSGTVPIGAPLRAAGLSAAVTISGTDTAGTITITTGTTGISAGELAKLTFAKAFGAIPRIIISGQDDLSLGARIFPSNKTAADFTLQTAQSLPPDTTYTFDYFIVQ